MPSTILVVLNEYFPRVYSEVLGLAKGIFLEKIVSFSRTLFAFIGLHVGGGGRCHRVAQEMAHRDALATQQRPESAEEEGIVRKYKTFPQKKINRRAHQTAFDFDDCRAINISR